MADESPSPKKIGSLRDRIAAFEKQSTPSNTSSNPPPTRPKPGNVSWKPKQPSPPPSPSNKDKDRVTPAKSSMSATDAKESIGQGISLRERMAALQGKGGFGPANPPPKPTTEKPKWKPPPKPVASPSPTEEKPPVDLEAVIRSPPSDTEPVETPAEKPTESTEQGDEGDEAKDDPEEEERRRRAAIAARMQRLGGARIGMAPPVVPPKPPTKRLSVQKGEETKSVSSSPPVAEDAAKERGEPQPEDSVDKPSEPVSTSSKPPTSMPVPAAPRRAAPPRRKKDAPKPSEEPPAPPQEAETVVPEAKIPLPESTSNLLADVEGEKTEAPPDIESKPVPTTELSPPPVKDESPESAKDSGLVTERSTSPTLVKPGDHDDVPEDARVPAPLVEDQPVPPLSEEKLAEVAEEGKKEIEERSGIDQPEQGLEEPLNEVSGDEEATEQFGTVVEKEHPKAFTAEPDIKEDAGGGLGEQPEEEEDEAARRARISARLAKSGSFNPFAGGPPARKPSGSSLPERRTSLESPGPFKPTLHEEQELPTQPLARRDADSLGDEAGLLTTETKEEDKPFDILKSVEDNDRKPDEVLDRGAPNDDVDVEPVEVPAPPFTVPPPPPLTSRPVPPIQPVPGPAVPAETSASAPPPPPQRSPEQRQNKPIEEEPGPPPPLPSGRPSGVPPPPPPPIGPRSIPFQPGTETQELGETPRSRSPPPSRVTRVASHESEGYEEEPSPMSFDFPRYTNTASQPQKETSQPASSEQEVLADEDGDPIDPGFIPPKSPSIKSVKPPAEAPKLPQEELIPEFAPEEVDEEQARKRRLAERMAKLGGIRFGGPPPIGRPPPQKVQREAEAEGQDTPKEEGQPEEEENEQARRQRIAAKLAGMGGMRIGMAPGTIPPKPPVPTRKDSASTEQPERRSVPPPLRSPPPVRAPPPPAQTSPPPTRSNTGNLSEDDVVKVEMEESEAEEVDYHVVSEEVPPPIPSRTSRPPIPGPGNFRRSSTDSITFPSQNTAPARFVLPTSSEYVMVEEPDSAEGSTPPPPPRLARPPRAAPPPPAPSSDLPDNMTMSQWELPPIPSSSLDMETSVANLSASSWSESFDTEETSQEKTVEVSTTKARRQREGSMTADQLTATWGRVGIQVCEVAVELFEKSKKTLIGDGTYVGFVNAVLDRVPNTSTVEEDATSFGYLIYVQTGPSVTKRAAEIMPGDIITLQDAKLKGHKGLQTYHRSVGEGTPVVAIIGEYEPKKSKAKAYQASQHVGNQTVESVSYRLEDLKSGSIRVYRVLES